ncbi:MAG: heme biosynthesis protein HemY [Paracoccaceae bacterium]
MLSRFAYVLIILGVILAGAFGLDFLLKQEGSLVLTIGGTTWPLTLFEAAIGLTIGVLGILLAILAVKLLLALFLFIVGRKDAFGTFFTRRRERSGLDALSKSMVALASGNAPLAKKKAALAERKLMRPELTRLINAQAAELSGDDAKAETYYKALMADDSTAYVGAHGLIGKAMDAGDTDRALKLAEFAREIAPKDETTLETLYTLQSQKFDWEAARKTLTDQRRAKHVPKLEASRREAALILAQAEDAERVGEDEHARALAVEAAKMDLTNVNAVSAAVRHLVASGSKRAASKLVTDSWRSGPHPVLAAAFASIEPDESPAQRQRRFQALFNLHPEDDETRFVRAELALVAEDFKGARAAIQDLRETDPSVRSCAIMAAVSRGEGEPDYVVRGWLARALGAPKGNATEGIIDHAAMLPLLIGAPDEIADEQSRDLPGGLAENGPKGDGPIDAEDAEPVTGDTEAKPRSEAAA